MGHKVHRPGAPGHLLTGLWAISVCSGLKPSQASSLQGGSLEILSGLCWLGWSRAGPQPRPLPHAPPGWPPFPLRPGHGLCHSSAVRKSSGSPPAQWLPHLEASRYQEPASLPGGEGDPEWRTGWRTTERMGRGDRDMGGGRNCTVTTWRSATSGRSTFRKIQARAWVVFRIMEILRIWWGEVSWG